MPSNRHRSLGLLAILVSVVLALAAQSARACTIFVLTDANHALFCNGEDWSTFDTRIWFQPAGKGYYGAVYVGFDNGWPQGGLNTEGLAYDWVMFYKEPTQKGDPNLPATRGPACRRMLETCATVQEAVAFYRTHAEPAFGTSKILVADKTGASVIIGVKGGQLEVEESNQSRGFGFGRRILQTTLDRRAALAEQPEPSVTDGFKILHDCRQVGDYGTKYSNVFDLKSGDIFLRPFPERLDEVKLNLAVELNKGDHYYEMPAITAQLAQAPRPLPMNMKRFPLDECNPIPDKEPKVTEHVRALLLDVAQGTARVEDYTADFWKSDVLPYRAQAREKLKRLGELVSMTLVDRGDANGQRSYRYRVELTNAWVLLRCVLDARNKVTLFTGEDEEWKPAPPNRR